MQIEAYAWCPDHSGEAMTNEAEAPEGASRLQCCCYLFEKDLPVGGAPKVKDHRLAWHCFNEHLGDSDEPWNVQGSSKHQYMCINMG